MQKIVKRKLRDDKDYYKRVLKHLNDKNIYWCFTELGELLTRETCKSYLVKLNTREL